MTPAVTNVGNLRNPGHWMHAWAAEHDLDLGPEVNEPEWDGSKPDYDIAIGGLLQEGR